MQDLIQFQNVIKSFNNKRLINNLNLSIKKGEKILLYGPSGTGKSTMLKMILGFIAPDSGKILLNYNSQLITIVIIIENIY